MPGQLNVPDAFTRLIQSILVTGIAPRSFYERDADGRPQRAHYDGLPVDFVAESIITLAATSTDGYRSFDVMNPYDDGVSLDTFVDWLIDAGHKIARIDDYDAWLSRFETALTALPERSGDTVCCLCSTRIASRSGRYGAPSHRPRCSTPPFARPRLVPTETSRTSRSR